MPIQEKYSIKVHLPPYTSFLKLSLTLASIVTASLSFPSTCLITNTCRGLRAFSSSVHPIHVSSSRTLSLRLFSQLPRWSHHLAYDVQFSMLVLSLMSTANIHLLTGHIHLHGDHAIHSNLFQDLSCLSQLFIPPLACHSNLKSGQLSITSMFICMLLLSLKSILSSALLYVIIIPQIYSVFSTVSMLLLSLKSILSSALLVLPQNRASSSLWQCDSTVSQRALSL